MECSKREPDAQKRKHLELLAFGKGGNIIHEPGRLPVYVTEEGDFPVPSTYSDKDRFNLDRLMWHEDTDFHRMEEAIKHSTKLWNNVKKRDKLRIIDKYVLQLQCDNREKKLIKSIITIALILRLLESNDIVYKDFEIKNIGGNFNVEYFSRKAQGPQYESRSHSVSTCKVSARDIWQRVSSLKLG